MYGVEAYNPYFCRRQLGSQQAIPKYVYTSLNLESSFRPLKISLVDIARISKKMMRLVSELEIS